MKWNEILIEFSLKTLYTSKYSSLSIICKFWCGLNNISIIKFCRKRFSKFLSRWDWLPGLYDSEIESKSAGTSEIKSVTMVKLILCSQLEHLKQFEQNCTIIAGNWCNSFFPRKTIECSNFSTSQNSEFPILWLRLSQHHYYFCSNVSFTVKF